MSLTVRAGACLSSMTLSCRLTSTAWSAVSIILSIWSMRRTLTSMSVTSRPFLGSAVITPKGLTIRTRAARRRPG